MSDNDLIKRVDAERARDELVRALNYINTSGTLDYADYCELFDTIEREFDALKVVPQEMTAMEYLKARERLCAERLSNYGCNGCPMLKHKGCDCETIEDNHPDEAVSVVKEWAREHPEGGD